MIEVECSNCGKKVKRYPSTLYKLSFCNLSCHRSYYNRINNPSWKRDISGKNNPMYGIKNPKLKEWNDKHKGENNPNWKGGLHKRKDGYYRINIKGKRYLYHRYLLKLLDEGKVIHHIDHNPSNNEMSNLMIFNSQAEHVKYESIELAENSSK